MSISSPVGIVTIPDRHSSLEPIRVHGGEDVDPSGREEACYTGVRVVVLAEEFGEGDEEGAAYYLVTVHVTWTQ